LTTIIAPAWSTYAAGSEIEHFAEFCSAHLIQSIDAWDGEPFDLEEFQLSMMGEALAFNEHGWPIWNSVVMVLPRKNGKTTLLAAYALYRLLTSEGMPQILLAASSDKQADRLFEACAMFIRRNPTLAGLCRVRDYVGEIVREDGRGEILRMSADPARLHGYNPSLVVCDELAQWTTPSLKRAYAALTSGGGARRAPQTFTITTAGEAAQRHLSILGRILDAAAIDPATDKSPGLAVTRMADAKTLVWNYEAPTIDPRDTDAMKLANPASWITTDYLARQAANPELSDGDVLQLHGCVWAAAEHSWLPTGAWDACVDLEREVEPGSELACVAFDGSYRGDASALIGCTLDGYLFVIAIWERPDNAPDEWVVPRHEVKARVHEVMETYRVRELACDPPGWHSEIDEWADTYGSVVTMFETNKRTIMSDACSRFYAGVVKGDITHDGNPQLARHLSNAVTKETPDGAYITKDGRNSPRKIDAAVAAVIAYARANAPVVEPFLLFAEAT
jgi:phage terminase large subunit-like protein